MNSAKTVAPQTTRLTASQAAHSHLALVLHFETLIEKVLSENAELSRSDQAAALAKELAAWVQGFDYFLDALTHERARLS